MNRSLSPGGIARGARLGRASSYNAYLGDGSAARTTAESHGKAMRP